MTLRAKPFKNVHQSILKAVPVRNAVVNEKCLALRQQTRSQATSIVQLFHVRVEDRLSCHCLPQPRRKQHPLAFSQPSISDSSCSM